MHTRNIQMTKGSVPKQIIRYTIPMFIGNLFQVLYGTVDSIIIGNFVGSEALAALGPSGPIIFTMVGFFTGVTVGASVLAAQNYGANDYDKLSESIHSIIVLTFIIGIIFTIAGATLTPILLKLVNTPLEVMDEASTYLRIYFYGITGVLYYNAGASVLRAIGDAKRPLYLLGFTSILNVLLDLLFVLVLKMGIAGVAWATLIAELLSAIIVMYLLMRLPEEYRLKFSKLHFLPNVQKRILLLGLPTGIQNSITGFSNSIVMGYIGTFGTLALAGFTAHNKVDMLIMMLIQSGELATTVFVGQNIGAGLRDRAVEGAKTSLKIFLFIIIVLSIVENIFAESILGIFTQDAQVISYGLICLRMYSFFYFILCIARVLSGALRGTGDTIAPMIIMLVCFVLLRQIYLFVIFKITQSYILTVAAFPIFWIVCAIVTSIYYINKRKNNKF